MKTLNHITLKVKLLSPAVRSTFACVANTHNPLHKQKSCKPHASISSSFSNELQFKFQQHIIFEQIKTAFMKKIPTACLVILLIASSCKKTKTEPTELEKLPPITQTGAKTFGCLVNGKAWTPYGQQNVVHPNFYCTYDAALNGGNLGITAQQFDNSGNGVSTFGLGIDTVHQVENINFNKARARLGFGSTPLIPNCGFLFNESNLFISGNINITRFDMSVGIISGTFAFKCKKDGCDTLNITDGRFDWKF